MCTGIILKTGKHLQSIQDIEDHFKCNLEPFKWVMTAPTLVRSGCTCQIDLNRFMNQPERKDLFEYDYVEYLEK